ncbi:TraG family conjugative transposon ATPase [Adhaeribacter aquaticus]|uniref:TraG family conjugative transposon ATPase n=1 Tax=Adhaeribacter aquaticus TaxID=299567 RepID=UPI000401D8B9|nr:TraG family conjugative transposon ATPase [Adhaeribacter aquaticus]
MGVVYKAKTLEEKLPLYKVEHDCIINKFAEITVCFRVDLKEIFTLSLGDYESLQQTWIKALKILPKFTIVHKQDWFVEEKYRPDFSKEDLSFLDRSFERHFNERPFLNHYCYLYLTLSSPEKAKKNSMWSSLVRGKLIPKEIDSPGVISNFFDTVSQFQRILTDSGYVGLERLKEADIIGSQGKAGLLERYLSVSQDDIIPLADIDFTDGLQIGSKHFNLFTLSDIDDLPGIVSTEKKFDRLSTDKSSCNLGFASPVGLMLSCNHIYNQYFFIDDHAENLKDFERKARNLNSLSLYSRENAINKEWYDQFLNEAISFNQVSVRAHFNVFLWSDDKNQLKEYRNLATAGIASMDCKPRLNTKDMPALFWAGIPGNASDCPTEETFYTFLEQATCFINHETNYISSSSPFGIKMVDRMSGKPILVDISDEPMKKGYTTNRNKFILGPSGSGKSFFTNHMVKQYYEQGTHVLLVDTGNSYLGLCELINRQTNGQDGVYLTYTEQNPISFNPFYTDDNQFNIEKKESIKTLILTLWKRDTDIPTRAEEVALSNAVNYYLIALTEKRGIVPSFNTFYEFVNGPYRSILKEKNVREKDFDIDNFINVLAPYYQGGEYDYLLNSTKELDLLTKRFIVFELDNIKDHKILFPVVTLIIMETFINKMRRLKGVRKMILIEEAWKAIAKEGMAEYIKYLFKTVRKFFGEAVVVTQEVDDIIHSAIVKDTIINNSDCKILLDQRKYMNKFEDIQKLLGLSDKEKEQILSINLDNNPARKYKEVWIGLGGVKSAVYATEVSHEEYFTYTTEETEKVKLFELAEKKGNMQLAITEMANVARAS